MLQYLLNTTAIWSISLLMFDVLLRRQSYHAYNRAYLLTTFMAGLLLPLLHFSRGMTAAYTSLQLPVNIVAIAKQNIITTAPVTTGSMHWLTTIYCTGLAVALCILIADVAKLLKLYSNGKRYRQDGWTIIETHKAHAPFTLLKMLFVSSCKLYDDEEWAMLLGHERKHSKLLHIADIILMQLGHLALWFHPLVYIYNKRLTMVHEYQADSATDRPAQVYGRFLAEQCMLQATPSIAHALSNSPIKSRIHMLTHRSQRYRQLTKLLVCPLISIFLVFFTKYDIDYKVERTDGAYTKIAPQPYGPQENSYVAAPRLVQDKITLRPYTRQEPQNRSQYSAIANMRISDHYLHGNGDVILLAGMENNANAICCSSGLLWGSDHSRVVLTEGYTKYAPVYLSLNIVNPCTQDIDPYRKELYERAIERYSQVLDKWNEYAGDINIGLGISSAEQTMHLVVADDPWNLNTDKRTPAAPVLSIDRSIFGQSTRTIFDGATAMARQAREKSVIVHTKNISFTP